MDRLLNINKFYFLLASVIALSLRFIFILVLGNEIQISFFLQILNNSIGLIFFISLFLFLIVSNENKSNKNLISPFKNYINDLLLIVVSFVITTLFGFSFYLLGTVVFRLGNGPGLIYGNSLTLIISDIFAALVNASVVIFFYFIYKWSSYFKYKKTKVLLLIALYVFIYYVVLSFLEHGFSFELPNFLNLINVIIKAAFIYVIWSLNFKSYWVFNLKGNDKVKVLFLTGFVNFLMITIFMLFSEDSIALLSLERFNVGVIELVNLSALAVLAFNARLFISAMSSLLSSGYVEKRTTEISSLTFLNKYVAESVEHDIDKFMEVVTNLALQSCDATYSWSEIYENDKLIVIPSENLDKRVIENYHNNTGNKNIFKDTNDIQLIESIPGNEKFSFLTEHLPHTNSIIIIPLNAGNSRIGTLIVAHSEEYGFETNDLNILEAFGNNVSVALDNARLLKESVEKEKYKNELMIARNIQNKLLPQNIPTFKNYDLYAFSIPAKEVGGDYYDIVKLKNGDNCILIGDVSGKGMSAAFYMAQLKGIVLSTAQISNSPSELLSKINSNLRGHMDKNVFVTMTALSFREDENQVTIARAGHMPILFLNGDYVKKITPKGLGIGLAMEDFFNSNIDEINIKLKLGDKCLLFTDGVNEIKINDEEELGIEYLEDFLIKYKELNSKSLVLKIRDTLLEYENSDIIDDMTVICLSLNKLE